LTLTFPDFRARFWGDGLAISDAVPVAEPVAEPSTEFGEPRMSSYTTHGEGGFLHGAASATISEDGGEIKMTPDSGDEKQPTPGCGC
jgi:hypothetical protein